MPAEFFEQFEAETMYSREIAEEYHRRGFWGNMSIGDYLTLHAENRGERTAIVDDNSALTWDELRLRADEVAAGLNQLGIEKGDRVAFQLPDRIEWTVLRLGVARAGGVSVPVYPRFGKQEIEHVVTETEPSVYICHDYEGDGTVLDTAVQFAKCVGPLEHIFSLDGGEDVPPLSSLAKSASGFEPNRIDPDHPDVLALSSGTTGLPKIYYVVQNTYLSTAKDVMGRCSVTEYDTVMSFAPVQQAFGHITSTYLPLVSGATAAITSTSDPEEQWSRLDNGTPSFVGAIPTQTARLVNSDAARSYRLDFVRTWVNGGAPLPTDIAERAEEKGANIVNGYGAGDGGWATTARPMDPHRLRTESVGPHHTAMEVKVVDEAGDQVSDGDVGEVIMRGGGCCFGYFHDAERTSEVFDVDGEWEGWFHSNDAGTIDEQGNLTIVGRLDDMIVRGGQNIYPTEIEDVLIEHDAVHEAAVIGVPDPELGERVGAYVVEAPDESVDKESVVAWFDEKELAKFKWPERVISISSLPKSPGGKIKKSDLREDIQERVRGESDR